MTSSKKKHHPPGATTAAARPKTGARPTPKQAPRQVQTAAPFVATRRQWVIRVVAVIGLVVGLGMILIGVNPGVVGGWGKLLLMVPGALIVAGSFAAFIETTSRARSLRRRE